jgi:hypothetical protein
MNVSRARFKSFPSVGMGSFLHCTAVSTTTIGSSDGFIGPVITAVCIVNREGEASAFPLLITYSEMKTVSSMCLDKINLEYSRNKTWF